MTRKSSATRPVLKAIRNINANLLLSTNMSNESLIPSFQTQPTRILFFDEMKMLFDLAAKNFGGGIITTITSIHECPNEIRSEFKKDYDKNGNLKPTSIAKFPFLTLMGLTTESWFNVSNAEISGGFLGRFLPILSIGEHHKTIPFPIADENFFQHLSSRFEQINKLNGKFRFSEEVKPLWIAKYTSLNNEVRLHKSDQFSSFGSRLGDTLIKLCMIIAASMPKVEYEITPEIFNSASCMTDYFKDSYLFLLSNLSTNQFSTDQNRLLKLIRKSHGRMTKSDILREMREKANYIEELATDLAQKGLLTVLSIPTGTKPRIEYLLTESYVWNSNSSQLFDKNGVEIPLIVR